MRRATESDLLSLWEHGRRRHPLDRNLLLCGWARPDLAPETLSRRPLGAVHADLLSLHAGLAGNRVEAQVTCEHCGETLELPLDIDTLLSGASAEPPDGPVFVGGLGFRLPDSTDLAAVADSDDADEAARHILRRCCLDPAADEAALAAAQAPASTAMEEADPLADLSLLLTCSVCQRSTTASLDPGLLAWEEVQRRALDLMQQVHALALAYGWTEGEVLGLPPSRRAVYLGWVNR